MVLKNTIKAPTPVNLQLLIFGDILFVFSHTLTNTFNQGIACTGYVLTDKPLFLLIIFMQIMMFTT